MRFQTSPRVARSSRCASIRTRSAHGLKELLAAEHAPQLLLPLGLPQALDPRVRRIAGDLLDAKVAVGEARDLRQMRDRDHLRALAEAPKRLADRVRGLATDARVDLVEDHRLASAHGRDCERDARE